MSYKKGDTNTLWIIVGIAIILSVAALLLSGALKTHTTVMTIGDELTTSSKACLFKDDGDACSVKGIAGTCGKGGACIANTVADPSCKGILTGPIGLPCNCEGVTTGVCQTIGAAVVKNYMVCNNLGECVSKCTFCANYAVTSAGRPSFCTVANQNNFAIIGSYVCQTLTTCDPKTCLPLSQEYCPANMFCAKGG
jgi:hypothetical protein